MSFPRTLSSLLTSVLAVALLGGADGGCAGDDSASRADAPVDDGAEGEGESGEGEGENTGEGEGESGEGEGEDPGEGEAGEGEGEDEPPTCPGAPALSDPCLADACGNSIGVGVPCSAGGGECGEFSLLGGEAWVCTVDFVSDAALHMCTRPCGSDDDCGNGAVCMGDPGEEGGDKGCVPDACVDS